MAKIGLSITGSVPPPVIPEVLERCERLGFDEIWASETFFGGGPISTASIALATTGLSVGFGILSTAVRHSAALAMEAATLASLYPGRVRLGFGVGVGANLRQMDLVEAEAKGQLPAVVAAMRKLLAGQPVRFAAAREGPEVQDVRLDHAPAQPPPIVMAGMGKQGLRSAAELGDGVLLSWLSGPAYIRWAREQIRESALSDKMPWVGANAMFTLGADRAQARREAKAVLARSLARIAVPMIEPFGILPEIAAYRGNSAGVPVERVRDEWVDELTIAGDEEDCRLAMRRLIAAGLDSLILCPIPGERILPMLDCLSPQSLPALRR